MESFLHIPSRLIVLLGLIAFYTDQEPGPNVRGIEFPQRADDMGPLPGEEVALNWR